MNRASPGGFIYMLCRRGCKSSSIKFGINKRNESYVLLHSLAFVDIGFESARSIVSLYYKKKIIRKIKV